LALETLVFYLLATLAVGTSLLVVGQRNPVYSVMLLIASFGALAGIYILLDAPFTAVTQIIVYAGAIMVLFLFVVMLLNVGQEDAVFVGEIAWAVWHVTTRQPAALAEAAPGNVSSVREIGRVLFTDYAFPFEATSLLILVAMVGAIVLARQDAE
jgi:NADH-quinone oxidoreductase subunit J